MFKCVSSSSVQATALERQTHARTISVTSSTKRKQIAVQSIGLHHSVFPFIELPVEEFSCRQPNALSFTVKSDAVRTPWSVADVRATAPKSTSFRVNPGLSGHRGEKCRKLRYRQQAMLTRIKQESRCSLLWSAVKLTFKGCNLYVCVPRQLPTYQVRHSASCRQVPVSVFIHTTPFSPHVIELYRTDSSSVPLSALPPRK